MKFQAFKRLLHGLDRAGYKELKHISGNFKEIEAKLRYNSDSERV
jgi:hypothetical protein